MTQRYQELMFSPTVRAAQAAQGSNGYPERSPTGIPDRLTENEAAFISARDSFYMSTNGADGWPYLQHRGGPPGFVHVLDPGTLAFVEYRGNRQYISLGNLAENPKASLFFMDYVNRARLKLLGHLRPALLSAAPEVVAALPDDKLRARAERLILIDIEAFDWNCPQYIVPRFTTADITPALTRLQTRIAELEAELAAK
ncbi:pyridoxamine 5'-phosphate oxidase family protein [Tabrizicola sp.]|uniref:pyridoxamine 5'-phosphate oxidase family protein n=1 Tax=Tabrizicola sp. TaxID=2005166 RepID=UPI003F37E258